MRVLRASQIANIAASFVVSRIGLSLFNPQSPDLFRIFVVVVAIIPFRLYVMPRIFSAEELAVLDSDASGSVERHQGGSEIDAEPKKRNSRASSVFSNFLEDPRTWSRGGAVVFESPADTHRTAAASFPRVIKSCSSSSLQGADAARAYATKYCRSIVRFLCFVPYPRRPSRDSDTRQQKTTNIVFF